MNNVHWICGEDICENCGDCLACNGGDPCYGRGEPEHIYSLPDADWAYPLSAWMEDEEGNRVLRP